MWLIGKTVNWANWDSAGRSNRMSGLQRTIFGFCISSVPHLPGLALSICVVDHSPIRMKKQLFEPSGSWSGLRSGRCARTFRSVNHPAPSHQNVTVTNCRLVVEQASQHPRRLLMDLHPLSQ
jgi:hypothetical protein